MCVCVHACVCMCVYVCVCVYVYGEINVKDKKDMFDLSHRDC